LYKAKIMTGITDKIVNGGGLKAEGFVMVGGKRVILYVGPRGGRYTKHDGKLVRYRGKEQPKH
jgi:hypothetical protein